MKYPRYLKLGNWLFSHVEIDHSYGTTVGGPIPENLYLVISRYHALNLATDIRTYEGLINDGAVKPSKEELLGLLL
jgi:hypothetical protein